MRTQRILSQDYEGSIHENVTYMQGYALLVQGVDMFFHMVVCYCGSVMAILF